MLIQVHVTQNQNYQWAVKPHNLGEGLYLDTFINEPLICIKKPSISARQPAVVINLIIALEEKTQTQVGLFRQVRATKIINLLGRRVELTYRVSCPRMQRARGQTARRGAARAHKPSSRRAQTALVNSA